MIAFIIAVVFTIAAFFLINIDEDKGTWSWTPKSLFAILFMLIALFGMVKSVPTGCTGILTTFGKVDDHALDAGLHIIKPTQKVVLMDNREQRDSFSVSAFSSDIQQTDIECSVNYMIDKSTAMDLYREVGSNYKNVLIQPRVLEEVKAVFSLYTAENLVSSRDRLSSQIRDNLQEELEPYGIIIASVAIEDIDFTDTFTNAVEAKQVAAQEKLTAETKQQQAVMEAEAAAKRQKIAAEAEAEVRKMEAEAEAYATQVKAEAEAEANKKIAQSLTSELIEYEYANRWDGEYPDTVLGSETIPVYSFTTTAE